MQRATSAGCRRRSHATGSVLSLALAVGVAAAACAPRARVPGPGREPAIATDATAELRARYDASFSRIIAKIPADSPSPALAALAALGRFRRDHVYWATLRGRDVVSLEEGRTVGGWLVIIPPDSELLAGQKTTLEMTPGPAPWIVRIKPEPMSEVWAGIFLVHELSHLEDFVDGVEPAGPTREQYLQGELRAYRLELTAADLVTRGELRRRLDAVLSDMPPGSARSLEKLAVRLVVDHVDVLEGTSAGGVPRSESEGSLRLGFYAVALLLRHAELTHRSDAWLQDAIEALMKSQQV